MTSSSSSSSSSASSASSSSTEAMTSIQQLVDELVEAYIPYGYRDYRRQRFIQRGLAAVRSCWVNNIYVDYAWFLYWKAYFWPAYIRSFFPRRSAAISRALFELFDQFTTTFSGLYYRDSVRICSLGGGPGCCIEGVKGFLQLMGVDEDGISATICDAVPGWAKAAHMQGYGFLKFDFEKSLLSQPDVVRAIRNSEIVILSYSLKFVPIDDRPEFMEDLMAQMSPGALLIIVDTYSRSKGRMHELTKDVDRALGQSSSDPGVGPGFDPDDEKMKMAVKVWKQQGVQVPAAHEFYSDEDELAGALGGLSVA